MASSNRAASAACWIRERLCPLCYADNFFNMFESRQEASWAYFLQERLERSPPTEVTCCGSPFIWTKMMNGDVLVEGRTKSLLPKQTEN